MKIRMQTARCSGVRRRIWDIYNGYHCSIVGTCLQQDELRKIAKKKVFSMDMEKDDFELHTAMVGLASENSSRAKALHTYLDAKYQSALVRYSKVKTDEAIETLWRMDSQRGSIAGPFWAIMTSLAPSQDLVHRIYGEIHMLGHDFLCDHQRNLRVIEDLRGNRALIQEILVSERQHYLEQKKALLDRIAGFVQWEEKHVALEKENKKLQADKDSLLTAISQGSSVVELNHLKVEIAFHRQNTASLCGKIDNQRSELRHSLAMISQLKEVNERIEREKLEVQRELEVVEASLLAQVAAPNCGHCSDQMAGRCPGRDLCGKKVLYVGGQSKMVPHYQQMVERYGGQFMHHDGGVEAARNQLPKMLGSADVVFCPVDCVSHDACTCVKKMCKNYQKPFVMMRSSGLSTLARELGNIIQ